MFRPSRYQNMKPNYPENAAPPVRITSEMYWFSLIVLTANIIWAVVSMFVGNPIGWATPSAPTRTQTSWLFLLFFAAVFIETTTSGSLSRQSKDRPKVPKGQLKTLDYALIAAEIISTAGFVFCLLMLLISKGGPEVIDGVYYITSHGDIVREISREYLCFLSCCERWLFSGGLIVFTSHVARDIRARFVLQGSTKK